MQPKRECPICGHEFIPTNSQQKYCGKPCAKRAEKRRYQEKSEAKRRRHCQSCGKEFVLQGAGQKYCCKSCRRASELERKKKPQQRDKPVYQKVCPYCGGKFQTTSTQQQYCSQKCVRDRNKNRANWTKGDENRPYTPDTGWLIRKWHSEGMKLGTIGEILRRSRENVQYALAGLDQVPKRR